jgi:hypothetical protein
MSIIQGNSKSSAAGGYTIDQSIRFNDDDSAYLEWSGYSGSPTSGTDCTFSFWVKRCKLGATQVCIYGGDASGSTYEGIRFDSDDQFRVFQASSAYDIITSQVFRDVSAWSHFVVAFDTDNGTAADRIKIYHNGSRITDFSLETNPSSGYVTNFNTGGAGEAIQVGREGGNSQFLDGYLAEINFVDGQALDPTSFGETNADTGQWVPVRYTGSYGINGYYITGADSADLGADDSGNGNDFTSSGLTAADQTLDTPTDNYATLNPLLKHSSVTLADGNLEASAGTNGWFGSIGTVGIKLGDKVYFEGKCLTNTRLYFGLSRVNGSGGTIRPESDSTFEGGQSDTDYMWRVTDANTVYYQTTNQSVTVSAVAVNDIVGCSVDTDGTVKFYKNGTEIHSFSTTLVAGDTYMPVYSVNGATSTEKWEARFGSTGISHQPTGFSLLRTSDMDDPTIADPSAYFQISLWNGNGSTQTITQDGNSTFQPGWIWSKGRNNLQEHVVFDEVRGTTKYLKVSPAGTEGTQSGVTAFNSDGFDLGSWAVTNGSGQTHVGWQWKAGGTSGSSNTDGSITSTVSADTTSGFSIATYTGNATVGATVGHGLGVAPKMVIVKSRSNSENWVVGHDSMGWTKGIYLNSTSAPFTLDIYWNNTAPTSSVVELHDHVTTNGSGYTYVMYSFAEVEGFSKFGSYTGNGSTNGAFIYTGFKPAFVLWKQYTNLGTNSWGIRDSARDPYNVVESVLRPDTSAAETTASSAYADFLSNGFKLRATDGFVNKASSNYLYMAFAESPFKTATAR